MCLYVHKHSEVILQAFFRHYDRMIVEFFTLYYVQLDELEAVTSREHNNTVATPPLRSTALYENQRSSFYPDIIIYDTFIQLECILRLDAHGEFYINT